MNRDSDDLIIDQFCMGNFVVFTYLITDRSTNEAIIIDPAAEPKKIIEKVNERKASVKWIVCTHTHPDHIGAVAPVKKETKASLVLHPKEVAGLNKLSNLFLVPLFGGKPLPKANVLVKDGDTLPLGRHKIKILHTPGHSSGSICLNIGDHLFSGDTLFVGGVGRTDLPGASWKGLERSLRVKILSMPDNTRIWPGHDYGGRSSNLLGREKLENPFLRHILKE